MQIFNIKGTPLSPDEIKHLNKLKAETHKNVQASQFLADKKPVTRKKWGDVSVNNISTCESNSKEQDEV